MASSTQSWWSVLRLLLLAGIAAAGVGVACSDKAKVQSAELGGLEGKAVAGTSPCVDGMRRACSVTLGEQNGVLSCLKGSQECRAGQYGSCVGTEQYEAVAPGGSTTQPLHTLTLTTGACGMANPCDPTCQFLRETPASPIEPTQTMVNVVPKMGSILDYPAATPGVPQPCRAPTDCQLGMTCDARFEVCVPKLDGAVDAGCATYDLVVAPTCSDAGVSVISVCNRGSATSPVGIKLVHVAPGQIGASMPSFVGATPCATVPAIAAGKCVEVNGCPGLAAGREIVVNPQDGTQNATECNVGNNWSVYNAGACNVPLCTAGYATGQRNGTCVLPLSRTQTPTELLGLWHFDENAGALTKDSSGNGNGGVLWRAPPGPSGWAAPGKLGAAALNAYPYGLDPITDTNYEANYADMGFVDFGALDAVSVALWMRYTNTAANSTGGIASHMEKVLASPYPFKGWQILRNDQGMIQVELAGPARTLTTAYVTAPPASTTQWSHVAFTWSSATAQLRVYIDGVLLATVAHAASDLGSGSVPLTIGRSANAAHEAFLGQIDEVSVHRGVLSDAQVLQMAQKPPSPALVAGTPTSARVKYTPRAQLLQKCNSPGTEPSGQSSLEAAWGNKCYRSSEDEGNWANCESTFCARSNEHLISLNRPEEQAFQTQWLAAQNTPNLRTWIGYDGRLPAAPLDGTYRWTDNSCNVWTNWASGPPQQPDDASSAVVHQEDCGVIRPEFDPVGWRDLSCNTGLTPAPVCVCERAPDLQGPCAAGQQSGPNGSCYQLVPTAATYTAAKAACAVKGKGWSLATITSEQENNFVAGMLDCTQAWIGKPLGYTAAFLAGEPNPAAVAGVSDCPRTNNLGRWLVDSCAAARAYVCEGPPAAGAPEDLTLVAGPANCTGNNQYYLDNPTAPTLMFLCPAMCARIQGTPGDVTYEFGCAIPPPVVQTFPKSFTETYTSDCPAGTQVQWSFLRYQTSTPGNSNVVFEARAAADAASLGSETFVPLVTAALMPTDTQVCGFGAQAACTVDLFDKLKVDFNRDAVLELKGTVNPGSSNELSSLQKWEVTYSCPAAQ
ncbi:MAG: LamG-like jellyroll fold domain-containing protein [Polyangiaceae bacterium]|nr:LamG-like jellyroll fold domain-containing protein [Polyangiaceae bacterium]